MTNRRQKSGKNKTIKRKIIILTVLIFILLALSAAAYTTNQYEKAREESIRLIEENNGKQSEEDIEFFGDDDVADYIHVLLVGVDNEDGGPARTDTIMVAQYQPKNGKAKLISLMRDSYVSIPGYRNNKINTAFFLGGPELLRKTIKENFDIDIHYYALVDFNGFTRVVDIISPNGIEVDIARRMFYEDTAGGLYINFEPGVQRLNGKEALQYVRFRNDRDNDFGRVRRQQEVLSILKDDLISLSGITRLPKLLGAVEPFITTNIQNSQFLDYGRNFFLNPIDSVETLTIPVEGTYVDSRNSHAGAILELNMEKNKQAIYEFLELEEVNAFNDGE
ncbi:LytR family transcriptional regulator [Anaerobacillus alkaliphilus]|uniref:Regulatory protein MsrR n=1 Tax=Anaerobacillus alkaliphilus TaxID=1548597 RepID=A0A4Q0VPT1_9BACI|nr:LCP family protein [Anaerobacillus alkaliphilus]RXI98258.1 LytR family transcriptional regulator [Anaerobacillus alkaliphilus]